MFADMAEVDAEHLSARGILSFWRSLHSLTLAQENPLGYSSLYLCASSASKPRAMRLLCVSSRHTAPSGLISHSAFSATDSLHKPRSMRSMAASSPTAPRSSTDINAVAVTYGPGLEPCLWVGVNFAKALSLAWDIPIVAVNHLEGHIVMSLMEINKSYPDTSQKNEVSGCMMEFEFPILALLISGGNTQLVLSREPLQYEVVGKTRDDAAGEAFDKVARMMELPYPGGPHISRLAREARSSKLEADFKLPRPMLNEDHFDFSFSGLKTAVLRLVENKTISDDTKKRVAREFEDTVTDVLVGKTLRAVEEYGANAVVMGGGFSANKHIGLCLAEALAEAGAKLLVCPPEFSTDNAVMIALAGYFHARKYEFTDPETLTANGSLKLG